ncbi:AfaD family invasin [Enterobacter sp. AG326]|uniref:AfaD family invasin n=1 Tax=Enterobacter sp. AG326 TaxID=2183902 RepID=UPI00105CA54E|nr:AfaD family invasin [Enterobacter sp. AG326]
MRLKTYTPCAAKNKHRSKVKTLYNAMFVFCVLMIPCAALASPATISTQGKPYIKSEVRDGETLFTGRITCLQEHSAFRLRLHTVQQSENRKYYEIQNNRGKIKVRFGGRGWEKYTDESGFVKVSTAHNAFFSLIADGNQTLTPGTYDFLILGDCS